MRPLVIAMLLSGCLGGRLDSNSRPSVMPKLSELPTDREQRNGILDQSGERARPENRKGFTPKERQAETAAAVAAALLGQAFSTTQNVTLGVATDFGGPATTTSGQQAGARAPVAPVKIVPATDLVPWVKLDGDQKSKPADSDSVR